MKYGRRAACITFFFFFLAKFDATFIFIRERKKKHGRSEICRLDKIYFREKYVAFGWEGGRVI